MCIWMIFITSALWPPDSQDLNAIDYTVWQCVCLVCFRNESIVPRSRTSTNWNDASSALSLTFISSAVKEWRQRLHACVHAGGGHFEHTLKWRLCDVTCSLRQWLLWETITVSHVCCNSVNHSNCDKCTLNYCVNSSIWHFKCPKVVQAHTLGEVGILGTVLLRVSVTKAG